jgi:chitinase
MELCGMVFYGRTSPMRELTIDRDNWAKTIAPNKDIKLYIGAPASSMAATSGYVNVDTLASCALNMRDQFSSFGGIMLWDASWAYGMSLAFID